MPLFFPRPVYLERSEWPLKKQCPPSVSAIQKLTASKIAVCCWVSVASEGVVVSPRQQDFLAGLFLPLLPVRLCTASPYSSPERLRAQGPWHFKHCQSSHFNPHRGASSATVTMTQPELYLEALDLVPCPSPSQSDKRLLSTWVRIQGLLLPENESQKHFPNGPLPSQEGTHWLEDSLKESIYINIIIQCYFKNQ